jgi:hypothetical protein
MSNVTRIASIFALIKVGSEESSRHGYSLEKMQLKANRHEPLLSGLLASGPFLKDKLLALVESNIRTAEQAR